MTNDFADPNDWNGVTARLKQKANDLGFALVGITATTPPPRYQSFLQWLDRGYHGEMNYLSTRREAYASPASVLPSSQRVMMLAMPYSPPEHHRPLTSNSVPPSSPITSPSTPPTSADADGRIAAYASGLMDYHDVIHDRLRELTTFLQQHFPQAHHRGVVDTAPILEREYASLAGLGWIGKNTLLLSRSHGSYFFLAALLTDLPLTCDPPFTSDHCGSCTACLDACPTQAFPEPYVLDARKCISYLTIEHRSEISDDLKAQMNNWIFGCDVCQQVCPWNRKPKYEVDPLLKAQTRDMHVSLLETLRLDPETFRGLYRRKPQWRAKWSGILRNAAIAAGNLRLEEAIPALQHLTTAEEASLRDAARWALERMHTARPTEPN